MFGAVDITVIVGIILLLQIFGLVVRLAVVLWRVWEIAMTAFWLGFTVGTILLLVTCSIFLEAK